MELLFSKIVKLIERGYVKQFYTQLKENLEKIPKENEKKEISATIKGCEGELNGFGVKIENISKNEYTKFMPEEKDYMKNALYVGTISFGLKDESKSESLVAFFEKIKPMIGEFPFIKKHMKNKSVDYFIRVEGLKVYIDIVVNNERAIKRFQEIGVDFNDFQNFKLEFKTNVNCDGFFDMNFNQFLEKFFSFVLSIDLSATNAQYLAAALKATCKTILTAEEDDDENKKEKEEKKEEKEEDEDEEEEEKEDTSELSINDLVSRAYERKERKRERKENIRSLIKLMDTISFFIGANLTFQFDGKKFANKILDLDDSWKDIFRQGDDIFSEGKKTREKYGGKECKKDLDRYGAYEPAKSVDIDEVCFSVLSSNFKKGIALTVYLPQITKYINENYLKS